MLKAYAVGFYKVALDLQKLRFHAQLGSKRALNERDQAEFETFLTALKVECDNLELKHTLNMALGIESKYQSRKDGERYPYEKYACSDLANDLDALDISFSSELHEELIFRIASGKNDYFEKNDLLGPEVSAAFPSASDNIRNAGTCFAVEQWDASVFHLMRVLERGLRVLATKFNVPFQNTTWHTIIRDIETSIGGMNSSFGPTGGSNGNSARKQLANSCFSKTLGVITSCTWVTFTTKERL